MTELQGKKRRQPSSCPEGWRPAAQVVQLDSPAGRNATHNAPSASPLRLQPHGRQRPSRSGCEYLAHTSRAGEGVQRCQAGKPGAGLRNRGQQVCRPGRVPELSQRTFPLDEQKPQGPQAGVPQEEPHRHRFVPGRVRHRHRPVRRTSPYRLPYLGSVRMTRSLPEGVPYEVTIRKHNGRWYASIACWKPPIAPPHRETQSVGRRGRGHQSPGRGQRRRTPQS